MRQLAVVAALSALAVTTAGSVFVLTRAPREAMTADIERDLQLASTASATRTGVVSAIEQGRPGAPSGQSRGQRMVVPTKKRAPKAAPSPTVMEAPVSTTAEVPETVPEPVIAPPVAVAATAPESATSVAATAPPDNSYPTPAGGPSVNTGSEGQRGSGDLGTGSGTMRRGGVIGAVAGAIIRGAVLGVDHCVPAGRRSNTGGMDGGQRNEGGMNGGTLGTIGGILVGGNGAPRGTIAGGPGGGRRW